jgi:putative transposase
MKTEPRRRNKAERRVLAKIGALNLLSEHRRTAQWDVENVFDTADLFSGKALDEVKPLSPMNGVERLQADFDGGQTVREVCREYNVHEVTFHRWKRKYGGLKLDDAQKLKGLERENSELKKMLAETLLENRALKIVNAKKF